jgi:CBS domain containing-hemolysin-like protein
MNEGVVWLGGAGILASLFLAALLGGVYLALADVNKARLRQMVEDGDQRARLLEPLVQFPSRLIRAISLFRALFYMLAGFLSFLTYQSMPFIPSVYAALGFVVCVLLAPLIMELCVAKIVEIRTEHYMLSLVRVIFLIAGPMYGPVHVLELAVDAIARKVLGKEGVGASASEEEIIEEIKMMVKAGEEQGALEEEETEMIHSIFELGDTLAREVMVPRVDVVGVEADTPLADVVALSTSKGYSRLPVYEGSLDNIIGVVYSKDLLALLKDKALDRPLREVIRPAFFVPGSKKLDELLRQMQEKKVSMAVVVDEYGGTDGIVTMEDLLEEIVGEIRDEHDKERPPVETLDDGSIILDARMNIEDVNALLDTDLPVGDFETLGGLFYGTLGRVPTEGESIIVDDLSLQAETVFRQRITRIRVTGAVPFPAERVESLGS